MWFRSSRSPSVTLAAHRAGSDLLGPRARNDTVVRGRPADRRSGKRRPSIGTFTDRHLGADAGRSCRGNERAYGAGTPAPGTYEFDVAIKFDVAIIHEERIASDCGRLVATIQTESRPPRRNSPTGTDGDSSSRYVARGAATPGRSISHKFGRGRDHWGPCGGRCAGQLARQLKTLDDQPVGETNQIRRARDVLRSHHPGRGGDPSELISTTTAAEGSSLRAASGSNAQQALKRRNLRSLGGLDYQRF